MGVHLDWCHNINNWIYYEINPYILNDDIINSILGKAQPMLSSMSNEHYCTFTALNKNHEPKELNKLRIFNDNTSTFQDILRNKSDGYYCSCRNFVKDCINIYQKINGIHCSTATDKNKNNKPTCDIVNLFDIHYRGYLYGDVRIQEKLPDLSSTTNINIEECRSQTNEKGLDSVRGYQSDGSALSTTPTEPSGKTMPTAIGTIVGVSSVLGLLYKVISIFYINM
ncbi:hypothetical protein PVNG_02213 [Plasmodium vivax North Korean]|uniref:Uncharacterized protein n=1 Tax=Plasmodium vivax North Korean TaxID=1035514 RepID=A0A0J9TTT3_PLAVI|nr:hypothetical protein PVNG_02213 [Plasmodium vivax North Korean]